MIIDSQERNDIFFFFCWNTRKSCSTHKYTQYAHKLLVLFAMKLLHLTLDSLDSMLNYMVVCVCVCVLFDSNAFRRRKKKVFCSIRWTRVLILLHTDHHSAFFASATIVHTQTKSLSLQPSCSKKKRNTINVFIIGFFFFGSGWSKRFDIFFSCFFSCCCSPISFIILEKGKNGCFFDMSN